MEFGSFPKNLAYNVKTLSGFSKTVVKLTPTPNTAVEAGNTFKVRLPPNTLVDLRTLSLFYEGTCTSSSGAGYLRFPRLSSSIIDTLNIYVNGTLIENIQAYGDLYNALYDISAAGDQTAKRYLENSDPSIYVENTVNTTYDDAKCGKIVKATAYAGGLASHATKQVFCINNWLGFIGSSSTPVIDTNDTGVIEIEIRLKPATILWSTNADAAGADPSVTGPNYKIDNISFNVNKIVFNDPLYYNLKASKLLGDGLTIGYQTYICSKSGAQSKSTSMNINTNINTTSLDQLILTSAPAVPQVQNLLLYNAGAADNLQLTFNQAKAGLNVSVTTAIVNTNNIITAAALSGATTGNVASVATNTLTYTPHVNTTSISATAGATFGMMTPNAADVGDLFNQSQAFRRDLVGLATSSVEINNIPLTPQPLKPWEMFNETLIALGNHNLDLSAGVHEGCLSLPHFCKYYGTHIVSLENIQTDGFYKSGLDGKSFQKDTISPVLPNTTNKRQIGKTSTTHYKIWEKITRRNSDNSIESFKYTLSNAF
jgi:hypothetical protein